MDGDNAYPASSLNGNATSVPGGSGSGASNQFYGYDYQHYYQQQAYQYGGNYVTATGPTPPVPSQQGQQQQSAITGDPRLYRFQNDQNQAVSYGSVPYVPIYPNPYQHIRYPFPFPYPYPHGLPTATTSAISGSSPNIKLESESEHLQCVPVGTSFEIKKVETTAEVDEEKRSGPRRPVLIGRRRGGSKILPTGVIKRDRDRTPGSKATASDSKGTFSKYMAEVEEYRKHVCADDRPNRPLVK